MNEAFSCRIWKSTSGGVLSKGRKATPQKGRTWNSGGWQEVKMLQTITLCGALPPARMHTDVLSAGIVFPFPHGIAGKVFWEHPPRTNAHQPCWKGSIGMLSARRQVGTERKPSPLASHCSAGVNLSGICWESGGNLLSPVVFIGSFHVRAVPIRSPLQRHPAPSPREDVPMTKTSCLALRLRLEMSTSAFSPRSLHAFHRSESGPRQMSNVPLAVLAGGCLESLRHKSRRPAGSEHCQRSANSRAEATSKIIKVLFLKTSTAL